MKRKLNILNWSSYIPGDVILDFEKETGIKVNYNTYSSNEECLAKVSNAKEGTYDLIFPSDYMVEVMKSRDLLEKLDKTRLNNVNNLNMNGFNIVYLILLIFGSMMLTIISGIIPSIMASRKDTVKALLHQ